MYLLEEVVRGNVPKRHLAVFAYGKFLKIRVILNRSTCKIGGVTSPVLYLGAL